MDTPTVRILLVEDFIPYRTLVTSLLAGTPGLQVIGRAADGQEAVEKAQQLNPDLILLDIGLPKLNGLEAARRIRELLPASKIVFLTQHASPDIMDEALSLGAWGYIVKQNAAEELLKGLTRIVQGHRFVSDGLNGNGSHPA